MPQANADSHTHTYGLCSLRAPTLRRPCRVARNLALIFTFEVAVRQRLIDVMRDRAATVL
jgi:hypothetical protein